MPDAASNSDSPIMVKATANGLLLPVHAQPGAKRNGIVGSHAGRLKVAVTEPPDKGKANQAIQEELARALLLRPAQLRLISGQASRQKSFLVEGLSLSELQARLSVLIVTKR